MKAKSIIARILLALAVTVAAAAACVKFDDSEIQSELSGIKSRLSALEEKVNTNIAGLWEIVNAQKNGIQITSVSETDDTWIISFSNGKTATVSKGKSPVIGVARHQGVYYWTLDDEWLLDASGNKLPVSGAPGTTPQLKIDGGYWYVSTDEGKTWTKLGKATGEDGDSFFKEITWDDDYVYLTLQNGTKFELRRGDGLVASIAAIPDYSDGAVKAGTGLFTIRFKVEPGSAAEGLLYLDNKCFKLSAAYTETKASAGELTTLPVHELDAKDGILTITTDGESLAKEFASKKLGVSAALFISDGASLALNSGYFPLYPKNEYNGHGYVDLGLDSGNKFADTNLGAENPWEPGNYYAWGELEPKKDYSWATYKWCDGTEDHITKYNETDGLKSFADDNYKDDVARQEWGGEWHIPTKADWDELMDKSKFTWTWASKNGSKGYEIKSKKPGYEGESIFLPAAGYRDGTQLFFVGEEAVYWSSTLYAKNPTGGAIAGGVDAVAVRCYGLAIRPILGKYEHKTVTGVSLDRTSLTMVVGTKRHLNAKVEPESIKNPKLVWTSADASVATVAKDGTVTAVSVGTTTVTVKTVDGGFTATCAVTVISPSDVPAPEAVDLGLSVKWANVNVGAISPEDYGDPFSWGETETKDDFSWSEYKFLVSGDSDKNVKCNKYCTLSLHWGGSYPMDNKTVLDPEDDVAQVNWGGSWRMPTRAEWEELRANCTWRWRTVNGVQGMLVTSKMPGYTDKSIFLPAPGHRSGKVISDPGTYGCYWSSNLYASESSIFAHNAWGFFFGPNHYGDNINSRCNGFSVRPVYGEFIPVKSISLDQTTLELNAGDKQQLTATVSPSNATAKDIHWASSDESIAKVNWDGLVTAVAPGTATITAYGSSGVSASCTVTVKIKGAEPEYVDLGLPSGTKWATFNVGATKPEEAGDYFAWGETAPKSNYSWSTYKWCNGSHTTLTKYNTKSSYGTVDNKTVLDPEDDAAHVNWGGSWRMPTDEEWTELRTKCTWTWTTENGVKGSKLTGPNGKSIFLPAAGEWYGTDLLDAGSYGDYWSSSLYTVYPDCAYYVSFDSDDVYGSSYYHYLGQSVRPVYGEFIPVASISLDKTSLELNAGDKQQLTATVSPSNATAKDVHWISSDESIAKVDGDGLVTAVAPGTVTITAYGSSGVSASCTVTVKEGVQAVDLGLPSGLKWASCNVGATKPEEYGDYFAWGETEPKASYDWSTYKWCKGAFDALTKYCFDPSYWGGTGQMDNKKQLDLADDAANANMGGDWRMPTNAEWQELIDNCTVTWTSNYNGTGVAGSIFTGKKSGYTGVSIFIPAAGWRIDTYTMDPGIYCYCWTSVLDDERYPSVAYYSMSSDYGPDINSYDRADGRSVRAVCP